MDNLQTTLEMLAINSSDESDELDSDFERELLSGEAPANVQPESNSNSLQKSSQVVQGLQNAQNTRSSLDDRIVQMEYDVLQGRIDNLVANNVPFGKSGLLISAVVCKDLSHEEQRQLQINAIDLSSFTNRLQEQLDNPKFMGFATISLVTDDLYQEGFQIDAS